ncbi:hypothetical protein BDM02DRAFT_3261818 [Thelephora ganbajun]|uniref:Uncharacterized protein n=1 Tax=Thelephora ganbajun TaxID=370292 RepID=A0ACB6ZC93_THEGA|nr:hypothetical protein BDM02DRAFT_3261818 [Thelephora ganbajun]
MSLSAGVRKICLFVLIFGVLVPRAFAAFAVCRAGWEWASNSKQQNPCEIAGALEAACQGFSVYELGPLQQGTNYVTPQRNSSAQKCQCNTVMYSLYMACTACQNVTTQPWTFWSQFCTDVYVTQYPQSIPVDTAIPHWAFLNYTVQNAFDPAAAKSAGGQPEVLAPVPSTVSLSSSSTSSGSSTMITEDPISTSTGQGNHDQTNKPSNVGAIVGGVIGGLAVLAAFGVGIWIFLRKRAIARVDEDYPGHTTYSTDAITSGHHVSPSQVRLYDPSDPSTYPTLSGYDPSEEYTTLPNKGHYTGAAEL